MEALILVAIASAVGAGLNTLRGWLHSDGESYSVRRLAGSLIVATFAALAIAQVQIVDGLTDAGIVLVGLTVGFTADYVVTKAKKEAE
tara:strand:+ start:2844 stop:3107 length:264 start_codon:yes stop_codon:yes gene_type:complete